MIRAHREAVLALLEAVPQLTVYDGLVDNLPGPSYVVLWASAPKRVTHRFCGRQDDADFLFSTTSVAVTAEQIGWVQEKVHGALIDVRVTIAGRSCERIRHEDTTPVIRDYDVPVPVLTAVDVWRFASVPA